MTPKPREFSSRNRGQGGTSKMRCVDVAALVAAAILRRNPESIVVPFDRTAFDAKVDSSGSILSLANRLAKYGGGGTDCSMPIRNANATYAKRKLAGVALVSDNESWVYQCRLYFYGAGGTMGVVTEWQQFVQNQVADKIRLLITSLGIPATIPANLVDLAKAPSHVSRGKWDDAAHSLTEIRNAIIHPDAKLTPSHGAYIDAWKFSIWFVEMCLLRLCEHRESYGNRLVRRWTGLVEKVPWSA